MFGRVPKVLFSLSKSIFFWKYPVIKGVIVISSYYFKLIKEENRKRYCCLLKMDTFSTDFQQCLKKYLPKDPANTTRSDQIRYQSV